MKIPINLASEPFRRNRALMVASSAVCVALLVSLGVLISLAMKDSEQLADAHRQVNHLRQRIDDVGKQQAKLEAVIQKPENATVLERSVFLNALLQRKGVSWNQIFTDLEKTIPYNVKLLRIHPMVDAQDHVTLEMVVAAESAVPVLRMLLAFRESPKFGPATPGGTIPPSQSEPLFRYTFWVPYAQKI